MSAVPGGSGPIEVVAFSGANSRSYLSAVFAAYWSGRTVLALPAGAARQTVPGTKILDRQSFEDDPGWFEETLELAPSDAPAQISFSSGTTGRPKAILLSHRALADVVARINAAMSVDETIREYVGVPVTFSFGFGRVRAVAAAGGKSYLPPHGFDPTEIGRMLAAGEINAVSAVPTLWRILLSNPQTVRDGADRLRWIEIGSQYMSGAEKQALKELFPKAKIVQHYGLTEASRATLLDVSATEGAALESVGRATGDCEIAISPEGVIRLRGPHLAEGLVSGAGVKPLVDAEGWLTTSDRGRIENGYLYYEGRADELINCGGVKIDPTRFEQALGAEIGAPDAIAVGRAADALRGEQVLVVARKDAGLDMDALKNAALCVAGDYGLQGAGSLVLREVAEIPRTATGKVQRAELANLEDLSSAPAQKTAAASATDSTSTRAAELQALWAEILGVPHVSLHESFYDLGGDSLSALTVIMRMEAMGLDPETARSIFEGKTIAEIVGGLPATAPQPTATSAPTSFVALPIAATAPAGRTSTGLTLAETINTVHATRGLLVWWVVMIHWLPGILERISQNITWIYEAITPAIRFGTPGFAMVFGMGIGTLGLAQYTRSPEQLLRRIRFNIRLIVGGLIILALFKLGLAWSRGELGDPNLPSTLFYSAISYYALAMLSLPWIMRILNIGNDRMLAIFWTMVGVMLIHEILSVTIAPLQMTGVPELIKILLTAKYGFFRMTAFVMVGVAIGYIFRRYHDRPGLPRSLTLWGLALAGLGFVILNEAQGSTMWDDFGRVLPWHLMIYAGAALMILGGFCRLNQQGGTRLSSSGRKVNAFWIASGMLALPIFVGHEIVIPAKGLLENLGLPGTFAGIIPLGLFLGALYIGYRKFMRFLV